MTIKLSKSQFLAGPQCLQRLYFHVHPPELAAEPDAAREAVIEQGREVGMQARQMFPGGVEVLGEGVWISRSGGSYSLKSVLPALGPEMTYEGMQVADGQAAGLAWESLVRGELDLDKRERIRKALLD